VKGLENDCQQQKTKEMHVFWHTFSSSVSKDYHFCTTKQRCARAFHL